MQVGSNNKKKTLKPTERQIYDKLFVFLIILAQQRPTSAATAALLLNLSQNLRILEQKVFLKPINITPKKKTPPKKKKTIGGVKRTSSPTLIAFPPQPGNNTRSPALTEVGTIRPSLSGAPGPTAITVASGSGLDVAEVGRNIPDAVFCAPIAASVVREREREHWVGKDVRSRV